MGTETRAQVLRGAAATKTLKCAQARQGYPECCPLRMAFLWCNEPVEEGEGKTGVSRRGNTSSPSGGDNYWA